MMSSHYWCQGLSFFTILVCALHRAPQPPNSSDIDCYCALQPSLLELVGTITFRPRIMADYTGADDTQGGHFRRIDENIASLLFGWCLALLVLTSYRIISSFVSCSAQKCNRHFCLGTLLIVASATLAVLAWTYQLNSFRPGVSDFAAFLLLWSLEAQTYFQLIVNRICILDIARRDAMLLRFGTLFLVLLINISMFALWLPSRLTSNETPIAFWWPRVEKVFFLVIDLALNVVFIRQVQNKLLRIGLLKYRRLIHYNIRIITLSILCDILLLGMQWYPRNDSLYILVHPVIYLNKLIFEMSICEKMASVSRETNELHQPRLIGSDRDAPVVQRNIRPAREASQSSDVEVEDLFYSSSMLLTPRPDSTEKLLPAPPSTVMHHPYHHEKTSTDF